MKIDETTSFIVEHDVGNIEGLTIIIPQKKEDIRGYFQEIYSEKKYKEIGIIDKFVQDNESVSRKGVLRGMHIQCAHPQSKLVRVIKGEIFDAVIDLRKESKTYGQWYGVILNDENNKEFYIPEGFAHGFYVLSEEAKVNFKVSNYWYPNDEIGILWNDPAFNIEWPIAGVDNPIIAEKDLKYEQFKKVKE